MSEIEITLPTVQYGNVKVRATPEAFGLVTMADAYELGVATAVYLNLFQQGFKTGAGVDVSAPVAASQESAEEYAQRMLSEGLGATEIKAETPPWEKDAVASKPKPWETGSEAPKASPKVTADW